MGERTCADCDQPIAHGQAFLNDGDGAQPPFWQHDDWSQCVSALRAQLATAERERERDEALRHKSWHYQRGDRAEARAEAAEGLLGEIEADCDSAMRPESSMRVIGARKWKERLSAYHLARGDGSGPRSREDCPHDGIARRLESTRLAAGLLVVKEFCRECGEETARRSWPWDPWPEPAPPEVK